MHVYSKDGFNSNYLRLASFLFLFKADSLVLSAVWVFWERQGFIRESFGGSTLYSQGHGRRAPGEIWAVLFSLSLSSNWLQRCFHDSGFPFSFRLVCLVHDKIGEQWPVWASVSADYSPEKQGVNSNCPQTFPKINKLFVLTPTFQLKPNHFLFLLLK